MRLIVGLGNVGRTFQHSRHNVGFECVDLLALRWGIRLSERRAKAVLGQGQPAGKPPLVLAKLRTYMNNSGAAAAYLLARFHVAPRDLVVIHDDMDLPLGRIRIRAGGGAAGHRGIESIMSTLATQRFLRLRVGIGRPPEGVEGVEFVLARFSVEEGPVIERAVQGVADAVDCLLEEGIQAAMNRFN